MDVNEILGSIHKKDLAILHKVDQLRREKDSNKVFSGFSKFHLFMPVFFNITNLPIWFYF